jgi:hypothetical protein
MSSQRFPVRFTGVNKAMRLLGLRPANSYVEVGDETLEVRMGPTFFASVPRRQVVSAQPDDAPVRGWGVHGWRGTWLVNGSSRGLVRIEVSPAARARVLGVPVSVRVLRVAVEDPHGLVEALTPVAV